jgi:hypothetical protein
MEESYKNYATNYIGENIIIRSTYIIVAEHTTLDLSQYQIKENQNNFL